jgi:tellurite resistance protein TerC
MIETTDIFFAVDSIPAIFGITTDPFIVYTSNIFAILGLRSLYFALSGLMKIICYLSYGLSAILVFIGIKILAAPFFPIPVGIALGVIVLILGASIALSLLMPPKGKNVSSES